MKDYKELDLVERLNTTINSYMSKEELLTVLEKINFKAIESCNLYLITDFVYKANEDKIEIRSINININ